MSGVLLCDSPRTRQSGVALAIVVWFVAGMSLLVAGIVNYARVDTKMAQAHVARAKTIAAGDGAIRLMLLERELGVAVAAPEPGVYSGSYRLGESEVNVFLRPANGLLDLNSASLEELSALLEIAVGIGRADADELAGNVIKWREGVTVPNNKNAPRNRFNTSEDLLRVEGMGRTQYDALRDYVVAGPAASGAIDWVHAPQELLRVLERVDSHRSNNVMQRRADLVQAQPGRPARGGAGAYRADAIVAWGGRQWLRRRWITSGQDSVSGLPWRVVRTEPPRVVGVIPGSAGRESSDG